jgi:type I restriction enzyme S subunit
MAAVKPYPSYHASGLSWVARIPEHWRTARLRYVARIGNGTTPSRDRSDYWDNGTVPWLASGQVNDYIVRQARQFITPVAQKDASLRVLQAGSVIVGLYGQGKTRGTAAYLSVDATINQALAGVTPGNELDGRFLHYLLIAGRDYLRNEGRGGSQPNLNCSIVGSFTALLPPRPEQDQIVAYLRAQDAHIARFIKAKRELIGLLNEQKLRIIDHAVTRGLDSSVKLKPSGVEWLGDVPEDWLACRLKTQLVLNDGGCWGGDPDENEGTPVLRSTEQSVDGSWRIESPALRRLSQHEMRSKRLYVGDLVITKSSGSEKHIGKTSLVTQEVEALGCCFSNFMQRLRPKSITSSKWIWFFLNSRVGRDQMAFGSNSTTGLGNLTREVIGNVWFTLPPTSAQNELVSQLEKELHPIGLAIEQELEQITLIREYRDRLISDVVTGQVDVRGWQPSPDDIVTDDDLVTLGDDADEPEDDDDDGGE